MDNEIDKIAWPEEINNMSENQLFSCNKSDTDGEIVNVNEVILIIGNLFNDWKSVQKSGTHQSKKVEEDIRIKSISWTSVNYNTIFKELDYVLQANLLPIPLSIQRAQMNQSLLYQVNLVLINQVEDEENNVNNGILGHLYNIPQIHLWDLLNGISYNDITEIWKVSMLIQLDNVIFHISHIYTCWFNLNSDLLTNSTGFITIINGEKNHITIPLSYMNQLKTDNIYTTMIRKKVNKKIQYGTTMSIAKTSIQIAITEGITAELIRILMQFIMKYRRNTSLNIEKSTISFSNTIDAIYCIDSQEFSIQDNPQPLSILSDISNLEYHNPKERSPKQYKSTVKNNHITSGKPNDVTVQKMCSYCSRKGYNIRRCSKYKAELFANKENEYLV
ncbi:hypothetical protein RhiirA4_472876 [Rhizophagus irregularis]|uniref:Uncharacterized protein n=1 Tax=Rhizophagus irregularis TaxID=588596 RepID=A0A2I1H5P1_9GLOM|nr:hypothetical protein RhiirA4_472876 [Rhizophagus irregularis]